MTAVVIVGLVSVVVIFLTRATYGDSGANTGRRRRPGGWFGDGSGGGGGDGGGSCGSSCGSGCGGGSSGGGGGCGSSG